MKPVSCCAVMGQGAGVAAAQMVKSNRDARDVDFGAVRRELHRQDVRLD